ncbi:MAG: sensor histidine kinase [Omnitrophica WOR_2 bacterium]|jgi:signal transduction histidine kinase
MKIRSLFSPKATDIYKQKKTWKRWLFFIAFAIVSVSLWYTNSLVQKIAVDERGKITTWANAIQQRARLVNYTDNFFKQISSEEQERAELLAEATVKTVQSDIDEDISYYLKIISNNTSIPVILSDDKGNIREAKNVDFDPDTVPVMTPKLLKEFSVYAPIILEYYNGNYIYFYYKDSKLFSELKVVLNDLVQSFFKEVADNSASVPVIITDSTRRHVIQYGNLDSTLVKDTLFVHKTIEEMASNNDPIEIDITGKKTFIYYQDSYVLTQLRFFPYIQVAIVSLFLLVAYLLFSIARRSEQNQVWIGLAKETAHQLGTPLSSMIAWVEYLKTQNINDETIEELQKDVNRLSTITERFSKIGSRSNTKPENIVEVVYNSVDYLKTRTSRMVNFEITPSRDKVILTRLNYQLFDWVIENLVKNAVDAMSGKGKIIIKISEDEKLVTVDVTDTGKGIPKHKFKTIFNPGYTSKQRGWGLGLSLAERIIRENHEGRIFVKSSIPGKETTFRIVLQK